MSGVVQFVSGERQQYIQAQFDEKYATAKRHGNHLWIATVPYFVTPPLHEGQLLDVENMAMQPMVGCFICESPYGPLIAGRRCKGEPDPRRASTDDGRLS